MSPAEPGSQSFRFAVLKPGGQPVETRDRRLICEAPIAIEFNGIGYAVMMATPTDLDDFAIGFTLSEQLVESACEIVSVAKHQAEKGWIVRIQLPPARAEKILARARQRVSESSCGLCGMDNLDEVMRQLPPVTAKWAVPAGAIFAALAALRAQQALNSETGAAHAAAFCAPDGTIRLVREDVGRHNALDKLLGGLARSEIGAADGFLLLTARCSFELVQKAVIANCPLLVTISAATDLAASTAAQYGLRLVSLARPDSALAAWP
jgi:FdhD protein